MLYQARTSRADHGKKNEIGEVSPVVHAVAAAWSQEIARNSATCSATVRIRSRGGVGLTPTHSTSGSEAESSTQRGMVTTSTSGHDIGWPCAIETYRISSALIPPSARHANATIGPAVQESGPVVGEPFSLA